MKTVECYACRFIPLQLSSSSSTSSRSPFYSAPKNAKFKGTKPIEKRHEFSIQHTHNFSMNYFQNDSSSTKVPYSGCLRRFITDHQLDGKRPFDNANRLINSIFNFEPTQL